MGAQTREPGADPALDRPFRQSEQARDVTVGVTLEVGQDDSVALTVGESTDVSPNRLAIKAFQNIGLDARLGDRFSQGVGRLASAAGPIAAKPIHRPPVGLRQ
jgi:hypothetical protein